MKKIFLLSAFVVFSLLTKAQSNIFNSTGNAGIAIVSPAIATNSLTFGSTSTGMTMYNTADQTTNYEAGSLLWSSNVLTLKTAAAGSGTLRGIALTTGLATFSVKYPPQIAGGTFNFSQSSNTASVTWVGITGYMTATAGRQYGLGILNSVQQTSAAGYTALWISPYESTVGSGTKYLIDAGTNASVNGSGTHYSKFSVDDTGNGYLLGNLMLGTTSANGYKLAVNGSAISTSMTVKLYANWPDYVFAPDYKLMPLTQLKSYLVENRHLPDMPAEDELRKTGLDLGKMDNIFTKKIEELTLYIIQKDKQIADLQQVNDAQEQKLKNVEEQLKILKEEIEKLAAAH